MATYTTEQYQALTAAIAQGALEVRYGDKEVVYRSLNEMLRIQSLMQQELKLTTGNRRTFISFSKGLK